MFLRILRRLDESKEKGGLALSPANSGMVENGQWT